MKCGLRLDQDRNDSWNGWENRNNDLLSLRWDLLFFLGYNSQGGKGAKKYDNLSNTKIAICKALDI